MKIIKKREEIAEIIVSMVRQTNVDKPVSIPAIQFPKVTDYSNMIKNVSQSFVKSTFVTKLKKPKASMISGTKRKYQTVQFVSSPSKSSRIMDDYTLKKV